MMNKNKKKMNILYFLLLLVIQLTNGLNREKHCLCAESQSGNGSSEAARSDYLWIASIRYRSDSEICIGTILNERSLLTTSRCVEKLNKDSNGTVTIDASTVRPYDDFIIGYGSRDLSSYKEDQFVTVEKIIRMPERYHVEQLSRDLAVIKTKEQMNFDDNRLVQPACFLQPPEDRPVNFGKVSVVGFGSNETVQINARSIEYNATSKLKVSFYEDSSNTQDQFCRLYNFLICLRSIETDQNNCISDIGSPIHHFIKNEKRRFVVGVSSFVLESDPNPKLLHSCDHNNKAYYMRLNLFMDWISDTAGSDGICLYKKKIVEDYEVRKKKKKKKKGYRSAKKQS